MTCSAALSEYFSLDKHGHVPLRVVFHLLVCPSCRSIVRSMSKAEALHISILQEKADTDFSDKMMKKIECLPPEMHPTYFSTLSDKAVRLWPWIATGLFMIIGFSVLPFTDIGQWGLNLGGIFIIPLALMYAMAITAFCAFFVAKNIDFFIKKFDYNRYNLPLFSRN